MSRLVEGESKMANGQNRTDELVSTLRQWQGLERQAMNDTAEIMETTESPFISILMEIIRHDSLMHHRVQQFIIDSLTKRDVRVTREDVAEIWDKIEAHDRVERKTIELATELREKAWNPVHKQLLDYLIKDETKHDSLLGQLEQFKSDMSKASGA
jgi:rubrerythrin